MARKLDDIFNECYERIRSGESLESCLARYPEHRAELRSLLMTAFDIGRRASYIHPRPAFKHWAQVQLEAAQHYPRQQRQPAAKPSLFSWRQSWAVAVTTVLVLLLTGVGTAAASSNAMPDETLYPVKLATEEVRLTFAISYEQKAQIHTELAEKRADEVEAMANKGKLDEAAITAERFAKELEAATLAMEKAESIKTGIPLTTPTYEPTGPEPLPPEQPEEGLVPPTQPEEVTEEQTTTTEETPTPPEEVTEEQTTTTEETPTPPSDTKWGKWTTRSEHYKKTLDKSTSKSLDALQSAMEKAPPESKAHWQKSIDKIKETSKDKHDTRNWRDWHRDQGTDNNSSQSDNTTGQGRTSDNTSSNQSQQFPWNRRHR